MKTVCKIPLDHMREITDGLLLYVSSNEVLLFVHGPLVIAVPVYHEVGDGTWPEGAGVPSARRSTLDPRYLMSGASRREARREQTHSAGLSHIERVFVCARCTVRNRMSFGATERVYFKGLTRIRR